MKCAVAIVLALIGLAVANPYGSAVPVGVPPRGLGIAAPLLVPSPAGVSSSSLQQSLYGIRFNPVGYRVLSPPLSFALPAIGYQGVHDSLGGWQLGGWGGQGWH